MTVPKGFCCLAESPGDESSVGHTSRRLIRRNGVERSPPSVAVLTPDDDGEASILPALT